MATSYCPRKAWFERCIRLSVEWTPHSAERRVIPALARKLAEIDRRQMFFVKKSRGGSIRKTGIFDRDVCFFDERKKGKLPPGLWPWFWRSRRRRFTHTVPLRKKHGRRKLIDTPELRNKVQLARQQEARAEACRLDRVMVPTITIRAILSRMRPTALRAAPASPSSPPPPPPPRPLANRLGLRWARRGTAAGGCRRTSG